MRSRLQRRRRLGQPPSLERVQPMDTLSMNSSRARLRVDSAYLAIEDKIVTLEFRPGSMLTEKFITDAVGLGRTPVREAIQRLTQEGLIEVHPRLGVKIAEIRPEDYSRALEPRLTLEPLLARSAARYAGPNDREAIAHCMHEMTACARRGDVLGYLRQDKAIDLAVSNAADNTFLPRIPGSAADPQPTLLVQVSWHQRDDRGRRRTCGGLPCHHRRRQRSGLREGRRADGKPVLAVKGAHRLTYQACGENRMCGQPRTKATSNATVSTKMKMR